MKFFNSVTYPMFGLIAFSLLSSTMASAGVGAGGGGDAVTEMRIDDIRADLVKWIEEGGARELKLPARTNYAEYMSGMEKVLPRHGVIIGAVTAAEELATNDEELKVIVEGQPKTCRGFVSKKDFLPHILCNTERFSSTPAPDQYRLIHHEYAGLVGLERNVGASSDYEISDQITEFLEPETVLKLSVKKRNRAIQLPKGRLPFELQGFFKAQLRDMATSACPVNPGDNYYATRSVLEIAFDCSSGAGCVVATQVKGSANSNFVRYGGDFHFLKSSEADVDLWKAEFDHGVHVANVACVFVHYSDHLEVSTKDCWIEFGPTAPQTDYEIHLGTDCNRQLPQQQH